jgi:hypothetical protein
MRALSAFAALLGLSVLACGELPGEVVGTYRITMKLEENSCGPGAVNLLNGHRYAVELRSDAQHGYWRVPGQPPLQGSYEARRFRFENTGIVAHEDSDAGPRGCTLRQLDVLTGQLRGASAEDPDGGSDGSESEDEQALDAGDESGDAAVEKDQDDANADAGDGGTTSELPLHGDHTFTISAVAGTDCSTALAPRGSFAKLPCNVRYAIGGVKIKPF